MYDSTTDWLYKVSDRMYLASEAFGDGLVMILHDACALPIYRVELSVFIRFK